MPSAIVYIEPNDTARHRLGGKAERDERTRE